MKELIAQGKIGRVVSAYSQFSDWMPDTDTWFTRKEAGGGCLLEGSRGRPDYILNTRCDRVMALNETLSFSYDVRTALPDHAHGKRLCAWCRPTSTCHLLRRFFGTGAV